MRIISIITAILVGISLYFLVIDRDRVLEFAGRNDGEVVETPSEETSSEVAETALASESGDVGEPGVPVLALRSNAQQYGDLLLLRGQTEAARQVELRAETTGRVVSPPLRKGAFVELGQEVCAIDTGTREATRSETIARLAEATARIPEAEARIIEAEAAVPAARASIAEAEARVPEAAARVIEAEARVTEAQINLNATEKLSTGGFAAETQLASARAAWESALAGVKAAESQQQAAETGVILARSGLQTAIAGVSSAQSGLANAEAGVQSAEASVAAADKELERTKIVAPFAGLLETDTAELGALLQPGAVCATILQLDPIKLVGFVPETEIDRVTLGAQAGARLATGREMVGNVSFIGRSADSATRTFRIEVAISNSDLSIRDGQTVEMVVSSGDTGAHLLPQSSLTLNNDGVLGVRVVDENDTAQFVPVRVIRDTIDGIWIEGLAETATVIIVGQEFVTDGVKVVPSFDEVTQ